MSVVRDRRLTAADEPCTLIALRSVIEDAGGSHQRIRFP